MGQSVFPAPSAASKTPTRVTLTSGTSWTVPAGVTSIIATLIGGGGSGGGGGYSNSVYCQGTDGGGGQIVTTVITTTPGASITYAIGAGGAATGSYSSGSDGGSTTMTGATTALGGQKGINPGSEIQAPSGRNGFVSDNYGRGGNGQYTYSGAGGDGCIIIEYWV